MRGCKVAETAAKTLSKTLPQDYYRQEQRNSSTVRHSCRLYHCCLMMTTEARTPPHNSRLIVPGEKHRGSSFMCMIHPCADGSKCSYEQLLGVNLESGPVFDTHHLVEVPPRVLAGRVVRGEGVGRQGIDRVNRLTSGASNI